LAARDKGDRNSLKINLELITLQRPISRAYQQEPEDVQCLQEWYSRIRRLSRQNRVSIFFRTPCFIGSAGPPRRSPRSARESAEDCCPGWIIRIIALYPFTQPRGSSPESGTYGLRFIHSQNPLHSRLALGISLFLHEHLFALGWCS
jgi:hypothetical protein